jgi:hypothetical protein
VKSSDRLKKIVARNTFVAEASGVIDTVAVGEWEIVGDGVSDRDEVGEGLFDRVGDGVCERVREGDCDFVGDGDFDLLGEGMQLYGVCRKV